MPNVREAHAKCTPVSWVDPTNALLTISYLLPRELRACNLTVPCNRPLNNCVLHAEQIVYTSYVMHHFTIPEIIKANLRECVRNVYVDCNGVEAKAT